MKGKGKWSFLVATFSFQLSIHTRHPIWTRVGINLLSLFFITVIPNFVGITWTWLTHELLEMGYMIPLFQYVFLLLFSWQKFNLLQRSLLAWASFIKWILCCTIVWLIPLISVMVHPLASLLSFRTSNNAYSWLVSHNNDWKCFIGT